MPQLGMAPPPSADVSSQMPPFAMASRRPDAPGMPGQGGPPQQDDQSSPDGGNPVAALIYTAMIHLQQAMQQNQDLAPYITSAMKTLQVGLGTVLGKSQSSGQTPVSSATPPNEPGVGMPI